MQEIEGEFLKKSDSNYQGDDRLISGCWECGEAINREEIKAFLHSAQTRLLEEVVKEIESQKIEMKETHICSLNDGKQNCDCYLSALSDIISKLKQDGK